MMKRLILIATLALICNSTVMYGNVSDEREPSIDFSSSFLSSKNAEIISQVPDTIYIDEEDLVDGDSILFLQDNGDTIKGLSLADTILVEKAVKNDSTLKKEVEVDTVFVDAKVEPLVLDSAQLRLRADSLRLDSIKNEHLKRLMDTTAFEMSPKAKALLEVAANVRERFDRYHSYEDTIIVNCLFLMPVYRGEVYSGSRFGDLKVDSLSLKSLADIYQKQRIKVGTTPDWLISSIQSDALKDEVLYTMVIEKSQYIKYNKFNLPTVPVQNVLKEAPVKELVKVESIDLKSPESFITQHRKFSFWVPKMRSNLQFSQVAYSDNWGGGQDNMNIRSVQNFTLSYNPYKKFTFNLTAEWLLNVNNAPDDTMRSFRIIEDRFLVTTNMGISAFKNFQYSMNTRFETQLFNNFKPNSKDKNSSFLSPGRFNLGVGMSYNWKNKKDKFRINLSLDPISYNLTFVTNDKEVDPGRYGIKKGHTALNDIGSTFRGGFGWQIMDNVRWDTSLFYFTNYEFGQGTWDNTFNFTINRLLSATLTINANYDDRRAKDEKYGYIQFKEALSFGFSYLW